MKTVLFICGSNGIGKTTICKAMVKQLPHSAYVDTDPCRFINPNVLDDETIPTIRKNISDLIRNYLDSTFAQTVIFSYGFHGRRKEIFDGIMDDLSAHTFHFIPLLLVCDEAENIRRMVCDGRDGKRIQRALASSRNAYADVNYPTIDISALSVDEAIARIRRLSGL